RETVGTTPLDYLTDWRISVAQTLLKSGKPLKLVAPAVGYSHPIALTRIFAKRVGVSPKEWLGTTILKSSSSSITKHLPALR
ncbi:MAG: helix-turn-helix domain-containing protein, partial [Gallionella sp.]|nr:helix-turn-helix domain-containing protein [Gallionella sp.]